MVPLSVSRSSSSSATVHVILFLAFCLLSDGADDQFKGNCPPQAIVDLTNATRTTFGFFTESDLFYPTEKATFLDGILRGCMCDMVVCLTGCKPIGKINDVIFQSEPVNYTLVSSYSAHYVCIDYLAKLFLSPREQDKLYRPSPVSAHYLREENPELAGEENSTSFKLRKIEMLLEPCVVFFSHCTRPLTFNWMFCNLSKDEGTVDDQTHPLRNLKYYGGLVAVPFLVATILIYSILPELRNTHGTTLRCYLFCLTLDNVTVAINRLSTPDYRAGTTCLCLGFVIYCASTASFLWLNVICFDLWLKFGDIDFVRRVRMHSGRTKMIWYSVYAWGITLAMTGICIGMELIPGSPESLIRPGFKLRACWFDTKEAAAVYYFGPIGVTIACNVCFFMSTAMTMIRNKLRSKRDLNGGDNKRHGPSTQSWFSLYTKLFILMGISWSTETMSWLWEGPEDLWYYTDTVNALNGILIFVVFVCKRDIWISLKKRCGKSNCPV